MERLEPLLPQTDVVRRRPARRYLNKGSRVCGAKTGPQSSVEYVNGIPSIRLSRPPDESNPFRFPVYDGERNQENAQRIGRHC